MTSLASSSCNESEFRVDEYTVLLRRPAPAPDGGLGILGRCEGLSGPETIVGLGGIEDWPCTEVKEVSFGFGVRSAVFGLEACIKASCES